MDTVKRDMPTQRTTERVEVTFRAVVKWAFAALGSLVVSLLVAVIVLTVSNQADIRVMKLTVENLNTTLLNQMSRTERRIERLEERFDEHVVSHPSGGRSGP